MTVTVPLPQGSYPIHIRRGALRRVGALLAPLPVRRWAVISDETAAALYGSAVLDSLRDAGLDGQLLTFPAGEAHKTPETWLTLCRGLARLGFTRTDGVLALGGGVTGDLAGFAAASYQRGMALVQLPTTLLAQVDSAVGGKTAVDLPEGKNLLGAFCQPHMVLVDPDCLTTLPRRQIACGMAEVIKYGFIRDPALLTLLESGAPDYETIIARCLTIKAALVAADERDTGIRRLLNFGHTIGHGVESAAQGGLYHGECVALGMLPMCSPGLRARLKPVLERLELPTATALDKERIWQAMVHDKKSGDAGFSAVFAEEAGGAFTRQVSFDEMRGILEGAWKE